MKKLLLLCLITISSSAVSQPAPQPYGALPSKTQLNWHKVEMYCIIHFGVDTYTDKEWGFGDEEPQLINPVKFNALQIVEAVKEGGFKGIIVVAKHHDGLCLWPTKTTEHNITKAAWKNGKGDMMKEYQMACHKLGIQMGVYCSPWDRNSTYYGKPEYLIIYQNQLRELYQNYGPLFMSWHDGANGGDGYYGGAKEIRIIDRTAYYDWNNTWAITRKMQPSAALFGDVGPDIRWVGNEEGHAGETCWATYNPQAPDAGKIPANGYSKYEAAVDGTIHGKHWMPAECDVSLRPGWFYHASENNQVKSPYTLLDLYYKSVGRGAALDLGLSPNREGLLNAEDVASLKKFGDILRQTFSTNLAKNAKLTASNIRGYNVKKFGPAFLLDNDRYSYWATDDKVTNPNLIVDLVKPTTFNVIRLRENIKLGQRIEALEIDVLLSGQWVKIASATSIGANRLIRLPQNVSTAKVRLRIIKAGACITLSDFGLYKEPTYLNAPSVTRNNRGFLYLTTDAQFSVIRYTTDGTTPDLNSPLYTGPVNLVSGGMVKAITTNGKQSSEISTQQFDLSKFDWKIMAGSSAGNSEKAIDDDDHSIWSTLLTDRDTNFSPSQIIIDMGKAQFITAFTYLPRQDKNITGIVDQYLIAVSEDGINWKEAASGEFANIASNPIEQFVKPEAGLRARYFSFKALHVIKGNGITAAEIGVITH